MVNRKELIRLQADIKVIKDGSAEVAVVPTTGDIWTDFGYWLEATAFMAYQAAQSKNWPNEKILQYCNDYLAKAIKDYK